MATAAWLASAILVSGVAEAAISLQPEIPGSPVQIPNSRQWDMKSVITGRTYRIFVAWPSAASKPSPKGYPVVYVLDGNSMFATVVQQARREALVGELEPAVIVGIGYPTDNPVTIERERIYDLSPPAKPVSLPPMLKGAKIGGAEDFIRFLLTELQPKIEALLPVDHDDRTLVGHSLGGLLVLHALFENPRAFRTYVAISPSIWWNDDAVLHDAPEFTNEVAQGKSAPRVLLMVGGLEQTATAGPRPPGMDVAAYAKVLTMAKMIDNVRSLGARLQALHGNTGYVAQTRVLQGETHNSEVPGALAQALSFALSSK